MKSKQRHDGGSYRRFQTMVSMYAKPAKNRQATKKKKRR